MLQGFETALWPVGQTGTMRAPGAIPRVAVGCVLKAGPYGRCVFAGSRPERMA